MTKGDFEDTCTEKLPLMSMGGRAEDLVGADSMARNPISTSGIFKVFKLSQLPWLPQPLWSYTFV